MQGGSGLTRHVDAMLEALRDRKGQKPRLVHRLDRDTSGVLVVARTRLAAQKLAAAFRARTTRKIYWALVKGVPKPHQGRISTWLAKGEGPEGDRMRVARHGDDDASHAVSLYSVVDQAGQKLAWLSMRPVTGRTHQLRAHAAHIGHPIIGDPKYFEAEDNWDFPGGMQKKLHLHARRIVIPHPSGGRLDVTAPLPPHMQQSWNLLGFDTEMGNDAKRMWSDGEESGGRRPRQDSQGWPRVLERHLGLDAVGGAIPLVRRSSPTSSASCSIAASPRSTPRTPMARPTRSKSSSARRIREVGRHRFEIITKGGIRRISPLRPDNRIRHFDFSAKELIPSVDRSLEKLGIDHVDVLLLHRPDYLMDPDETAAVLDGFIAAGKARHVGVSNFSPSRLELLASRLSAPIVTNQVEFSPLHLDPISDGTFDLALRVGHVPMIWSPIGGGRLLTGEDEQTSEDPRRSLADLARRNGLAGPAEAAIAFVARHPARGIPIIGSGKRERLEAAIEAAANPLDRQDWYEVVALTSPMLEL